FLAGWTHCAGASESFSSLLLAMAMPEKSVATLNVISAAERRLWFQLMLSLPAVFGAWSLQMLHPNVMQWDSAVWAIRVGTRLAGARRLHPTVSVDTEIIEHVLCQCS